MPETIDNRWDDQHAAGLSEEELLRYRSNDVQSTMPSALAGVSATRRK